MSRLKDRCILFLICNRRREAPAPVVVLALLQSVVVGSVAVIDVQMCSTPSDCRLHRMNQQVSSPLHPVVSWERFAKERDHGAAGPNLPILHHLQPAACTQLFLDLSYPCVLWIPAYLCCVFWDHQVNCAVQSLCSETPTAHLHMGEPTALWLMADGRQGAHIPFHRGQAALGGIKYTLKCAVRGYEKQLFLPDVQSSHCLLDLRTGTPFSYVRHSLFSDVRESVWGGGRIGFVWRQQGIEAEVLCFLENTWKAFELWLISIVHVFSGSRTREEEQKEAGEQSWELEVEAFPVLRRAWQNPSWQMELDATESRLKLGSDLRPSRASLDLQELCE